MQSRTSCGKSENLAMVEGRSRQRSRAMRRVVRQSTRNERTVRIAGRPGVPKVYPLSEDRLPGERRGNVLAPSGLQREAKSAMGVDFVGSVRVKNPELELS